MKDLSEAELGWVRIEALIARHRIAHDVACVNCNRIDETTFWLALLGWTPAAFMVEAYPEFYGGAA
jgi:hypothetical protein